MKRTETRQNNALNLAENVIENLSDEKLRENGSLLETENVRLPLKCDNMDVSVEQPFIAPIEDASVDAAVQAVKFNADVACQATSDSTELHCRSCDIEFSDWTDYLKHMKKFSFMSSNCLDYFEEKPWFAISDLIFLDVDGGVEIYLKASILDISRYDNNQVF